MYICLSSSHSPVDMADDSMGRASGLAEGGRRARSQEAGVAARSMVAARVEVVAGAAARVEVVEGAKGISRAVIYLPIM